MSQYPSGPMDVGPSRMPGRPDVDINATFISPFDRVRWGPIIAGLFVALSLIVLLTVLGLAFGLSMYEPGEGGRAFSWGAAIWAIIVMVAAFLGGGWVASRYAVVRGMPSNGILQGFLVWAVAIPLFIYFLSGALVNFMGPAAQVATSDQGERPIRAFVGQGEPGTSGEVRITQQQQETAVRVGRTAAWSTLISLVLGLGAAALGGYLGSTGYRDERFAREGRSTPPPTT